MNYNCPRCEGEIDKDTKYCSACGYNLELEYLNNPVCPKCRTSYETNSKFCVKDGSILVNQEELIPKCLICNTIYSEDVKFCPRDGGEVKITLTRQFTQTTYQQSQSIQNFRTIQNYPKASLSNRFFGSILDGLISIGLSIPALLFFIMGIEKTIRHHHPSIDDYITDESRGLFLVALLFYLIPVGYNFLKDGFGQGQSWGKKAVDIMVVDLAHNTPCSKGKSFFRNFISGLVFIIPLIGWLIEPIMVLATKDGRKLGDKAANTQVIDRIYFKKNNYELFTLQHIK